MKTFDIITEADARTLEIGATVSLKAGGHVTPLAADTLKARRVTVLSGVAEASLDGLAPVADIKSMAIGSDHSGVALKALLRDHLRQRGLSVLDVGTEGSDPVDYPDIAAQVARLVARREVDAAIVIDGAGLGSAIAANKIAGARAAMCTDQTLARYSREHNGANVLALGATLVSVERGQGYRRDVDQHADAGGQVYPAAGEDSRVGEDAVTDYRRVIELILEELARAGAVAPARCACHGFTSECCPDRVQYVIDAGATRLGLHAADGGTSGVSGYIDHTLLKPDATAREIEQLCREAAEFKFATVCVNPTWVALAARHLRGTPVGVCSVVGFPLGATTPDVKQFETRRAIFDGATEIDMVINVGALKSGDVRLVTDDMRGVVSACHAAGAGSKVIIETSLLTDEEKITALYAREGRGCGLREDVHRLWSGRRYRRGCGPDAPRRRR